METCKIGLKADAADLRGGRGRPRDWRRGLAL